MVDSEETIPDYVSDTAFGKQVTKQVILPEGEISTRLDLAHLPDGVYFIRVSEPGYTSLTSRLVLAKTGE